MGGREEAAPPPTAQRAEGAEGRGGGALWGGWTPFRRTVRALQSPLYHLA